MRFGYFTKSKLNGADLRLAKLNGADLWSAELNGADLRGAELNGADLRGAELNGADLWSAELNGADLWKAELNGAFLNSDTSLQGADITDAQLQGIYFSRDLDINKYPSHCDFFTAPESEKRIKEIASNIPTEDRLNRNRRDEFYKRIDEARKRCAAFNKQKRNKLLQTLNANRDYQGFIKTRQELACRSKYIAKGLLWGYMGSQSMDSDAETEEVKKAVTSYMQAKCPDLLKEE
ncbi:pentapeptide repeat-containing protein [Candidatus Magnetoovum chiemensis]|nr:pentapeptide repeat-containing protein [Candidatus Magnetoovum chiemensis]